MSYNVFNKYCNSSVTYDFINDHVLTDIFNTEVKMLMANEQDFELCYLTLIPVHDKFDSIIKMLLMERNKPIINKFPPNEIEGRVFGEKYNLNLRNPIDKKLFWYGEIYQIINFAVQNRSEIQFIFNDGTQFVNNFTDVKVKL